MVVAFGKKGKRKELRLTVFLELSMESGSCKEGQRLETISKHRNVLEKLHFVVLFSVMPYTNKLEKNLNPVCPCRISHIGL